MSTIVVQAFITLDGVIQAPGGPEEDRSGGFAHGGWTVPYWDDVIEGHVGSGMEVDTAYLFGRGTYEIMAAHWPHAGDDDPFAAKINAAPKYVVSTTLTEASWQNTGIISSDAPDAIAALKAEDGPDLEVLGSPGLIQMLLADDPDEYLAQAAVLDAYTRQQGEQLQEVAAQRQRLEQAKTATAAGSGTGGGQAPAMPASCTPTRATSSRARSRSGCRAAGPGQVTVSRSGAMRRAAQFAIPPAPLCAMCCVPSQ